MEIAVERRASPRCLLQLYATNGSRTEYVTTLGEVHEWAAESSYPWLSWVLTFIGFIEVVASEAIERRSKRKLDKSVLPQRHLELAEES